MVNPASYDSTTGKPIFSNDISNPAAQFQANADYAELQGPQSVALFTDLAGVANKRPNMRRLVRATQTEYVYLNSDLGWVSDKDPGVTGTLFTQSTSARADVGNNGVTSFTRGWTYSSPRPRRVLISLNFQWYSAGNAAGNDEIRIGGDTLAGSANVIPSVRAANAGVSGGRIPVNLTGTVFLAAGSNRISLFSSADSAGLLRSIEETRFSIYAM